MHFQPTASEQASFAHFSGRERLEYFLTRTMEAEEVWGHADEEGWLMREENGKTILSVWPYQNLAQANIATSNTTPQATSLEHFIEILQHNLGQDIHLDIMPLPGQNFVLMTARELLSMYESLMDAGTYFLEG